MEVLKVSSDNREQVNNFIREHWFSDTMALRGELVDMTVLDGFVVFDFDKIIGLITYRILDKECEIMSLDSLVENRGIGTDLLNRVIELAKERECEKIKLITTNDNINALKYYQRRGFDMVRFYHNALDISRQLKPSIPLVGEYGIPLKHEIEFEMKLF